MDKEADLLNKCAWMLIKIEHGIPTEQAARESGLDSSIVGAYNQMKDSGRIITTVSLGKAYQKTNRELPAVLV